MTEQQFSAQMNRMSEQYGKTAYGTERVKLIWREVRDFDSGWFERLVDQFLGYERQAPLLDKFSDAAAKERERVYQIEKAQNSRESVDAMSMYGLEDIGTICQGILSRIKGGMTDQDFGNFTKMLEQPAGSCRGCGGSGVLFAKHRQNGCEYTFLCICPAGRADRRSYPRWSAELKQTYDTGVMAS